MTLAVLAWFPRSRACRRTATAVALGYLIASIYAVPQAIGRALVIGFSAVQAGDLPRGPLTIVVLGAGSMTVRDWDGHRYVAPDPSAAARALEAARLYRLAPEASILSSGGLLTPDSPGTPTGEAMAVALEHMGVPRDRVRVETESRNTHDEAVVVARLLRDQRSVPIVLVTVDVHMRRSVGTFAAAGLRVIPAIAQNPDVDLPRRTRWIPSNDGLWYSGLIAHEVLGIAYYAARGWFTWSLPQGTQVIESP